MHTPMFIVAVVASAFVFAGCGSGVSTRAAERQRQIAACLAESQKWAESYAASLPSPPSQAKVDALARSDAQLC